MLLNLKMNDSVVNWVKPGFVGPLRVLHSLKYTLLPPVAPNIGNKCNENLKVLKIKGEFCSLYNISCLWDKNGAWLGLAGVVWVRLAGHKMRGIANILKWWWCEDKVHGSNANTVISTEGSAWCSGPYCPCTSQGNAGETVEIKVGWQGGGQTVRPADTAIIRRRCFAELNVTPAESFCISLTVITENRTSVSFVFPTLLFFSPPTLFFPSSLPLLPE